MAKLYPDPIDPDTTSPAERELYRLFREQLSDDYIIFHGAAWQSLDNRGRRRDGEADFVVAHPRSGILVIEVKGGTIAFDARRGQWWSTSASGHTVPIKNPFQQAKASAYALADELSARLGASEPSFWIGHAVAFPDVVVREPWLGPDKPRAIVMDSTDTANLSAWVGRAMSHYRGRATAASGLNQSRAVDLLVALLGKSWQLRPALWGDFVREEAELMRLTEQQFRLLDALSRHDRALISGCAGSGKTLLASEKASRLARQGFRTLLTCYNKKLAAYLRQRLGGRERLLVSHYHELCHEFARQAGTLPPEIKDYDTEFFNRVLPECLLEAIVRKPELRFDAIVVDEGQDFDPDWWVTLVELLQDPERGILYIFYDDNQSLYAERLALPISDAPYCLTVNCRNTQSIHKQTMRFYRADHRPTSLGPAGRPIEVHTYRNRAELRHTLRLTLERLTGEEAVPADEIVVLTPCSRERSELWSDPQYGDLTLSDAPTNSPHCVLWSTVHGFKGLERPVVILAELEAWRSEDESLSQLLYVACSRARNHLIVLLAEDVSPLVRKAFQRTG